MTHHLLALCCSGPALAHFGTRQGVLLPLVDSVANPGGCPKGTWVYHAGSHCCKLPTEITGGVIAYSSTTCGSGAASDYVECPLGNIDGACSLPPPRSEGIVSAATAAREKGWPVAGGSGGAEAAAAAAAAGVRQCPPGMTAYHGGSHCCRIATSSDGRPLGYRAGSCGSGAERDYIVCPYGDADGKCEPSAAQATAAAAAVAAAAQSREAAEAADLARIAALSNPCGVAARGEQKCVISFGLYGADPKYTQGMIRNAELAPKYFPGWVVRAYTDGTSPQAVYDRIKALGGEIVVIEGVGGGIAGMFWRFLVADDATVDRYIVRDSDSRLNLRERFAVQEWIDSGKAIHSIRDHPNHERPLNGGMWGGVKGVIPDMAGKVKGYGNRHTYGGDLDFLGDLIWPLVKHDQISHDAYSCAKFPNSRSFPTQRPANMQHVGQVYFADETTRDTDITCCMLNVKAPMACRRKPEWTNG